MGKDKAKDKEQDGETTASKTISSPLYALQSNRDLSQDHDAWDATLAKTIAKAVAREMVKALPGYGNITKISSRCIIQSQKKAHVERGPRKSM